MSDFPLFNTKELSDGKTYDLNDPVDRSAYFKAKLGAKIEELKDYLDHNTFVGFLLAKKSAGKGTYSKLFQEIVGVDRVEHVSVGDIVREVHAAVADPKEKGALLDYFSKHYRGPLSLDDALNAFLNKSQAQLVPTEFILTLIKRQIESIGRKAVFIDGFPRDLDQVSYSLFFRNLIGFRDDPDFFVLIDVPESVIDARMKGRVVCPVCHTSRGINLLPTKFVEYDATSDSFYLICDNSACSGFSKTRLVGKEGDTLGIESIRDRLEMDGAVIKKVAALYGIPKVLLRNTVPLDKVEEFVEDYEVTPEYSYEVLEDSSVKIREARWVVPDDGVDSCSLLSAPVAVSMVSQIHDILLG